jgi:hypothetical protein
MHCDDCCCTISWCTDFRCWVRVQYTICECLAPSPAWVYHTKVLQDKGIIAKGIIRSKVLEDKDIIRNFNLWPRAIEIKSPYRNHPIEITRGCAEITTGCCCFGQRSVQPSRATRLEAIDPVSVDTAHKKRSDSTAATAQTSCVRSDLEQTRSGRWRLSAQWLQSATCPIRLAEKRLIRKVGSESVLRC